MTITPLRIDASNWENWLQPLENTERLKTIECDAALFLNGRNFTKQLDRHGLSCQHAHDLLPPETASFLANADDETHLLNLRNSLVDTMLAAENAGANHFSLQLRLDDPQPDEDKRIPQNAMFLRKLLKSPLEHPFHLDIQVRYPFHYPHSHEWDRALAVCQQADNQRIGIALQIHPDDFDENPPAPHDVLGDIMPHLHVLDFHYSPQLGETLFDDELVEWAEYLKSQNYDGLVGFCPHTDANDNITELCQNALRWGDYF